MPESSKKNHQIVLSEPRQDLLRDVLLRLRREQEWLNYRKRLYFSGLTAFASGIALAPLVIALLDAAQKSGFYSFLSLMFTDTGVTLDHAGDFVSSLLESLPFSSLALVLGTGMVFFASLQMLWRETKRYSLFSPAHN